MDAFLKDNLIYIIIGGFVLYAAFAIIYMISKKKKDKQFEQDNQNIAKVHLEAGMTLRSSDKPRMFTEDMHTGYYFEEGQHTVNVSFYYETLSKRITVQESPLSIHVVASKEYDLAYDRKTETYIFSER